ncbi:hypothetical protein N7449_005386 [Penicillium cf. viridicatum]|uniref:G domain-containing protein n=1 Tax=Penicillium cf. viridicatum TaxID=2972119 RepID=A0A9W9ML75_9EURO|nr:hypothetical protein N7449_005386 [Penicillium cf. viridicatum]
MEHSSVLSQSKYPFRDPTEAQTSDVYIAIMGVTGAGKSTFISQLADSQAPVGTGLYACTQDVAVYRCKPSGPVNIWLVDTPGFDDTHRSDTDVLREIANWLMESFSSKKVILNGIIYLHRITDIRMQGSAMKNLFMFKKLCGPDALKNVILATTMWERVSLEDGERREQELERTSEFWGEMIMRGAQVKRHQNNANSAWSLVDIFASRSSTRRKAVLTIQQEMVVQHKPLDKTDAGIELESSLVQEREKWSQELERTRDDMREALAAKDKESLEQLRETEAKMNKKIDEIERAREELKIGMQQKYEDQISKLQTALEKQTLDTEHANKKLQTALEKQTLDAEHTKKKLQKVEKTLSEMQAETDKPTEEPQYWKPGDDLDDNSDDEPGPLVAPHHIIEGESYIRPGTGKYALSISGDRYFFCGPEYQVWRMGKSHISDHTSFVAMLQSHVTTHEHSTGSSNFEHEYPSLYRNFKEHIRGQCPTTVALGVHGHYFFSTDETKFWDLPSEIGAVTAPTDIKQLWLGRNDAFVLVKESGTINFNLKDQYGNLSGILRKLQANGQSIKVSDFYSYQHHERD